MEYLFGLHFFLDGIPVIHWQVTITVDAAKIAAEGQLNGTANRNPVRRNLPVQALTELGVADFGYGRKFHRLTLQ
jgi:hypothetical protein